MILKLIVYILNMTVITNYQNKAFDNGLLKLVMKNSEKV
jgi:hypothetical protein